MFQFRLSPACIALACLLGNANAVEPPASANAPSAANAASSNDRTALLYAKENDQNIELSVISMETLNELFAELAARDDLPYAYLNDGAWARAHKMVQILENAGVIAGKAFIEGELYIDSTYAVAARLPEIGLAYHVAPVVLVLKGKAIVPYILDPSLFSGPVSHGLWKAKLLAKPQSTFTREYYTSRFYVSPIDYDKKLADYADDDLDDMERTNRALSRLLRVLER